MSKKDSSQPEPVPDEQDTAAAGPGQDAQDQPEAGAEAGAKGEAGKEDAASPAEPTPEERIKRLEDDLLRAKAENQNTAKRLRAEIDRAAQRGAENVVAGLLDIIDSLERALDARTENHQAVLDGVAMTLAQFRALLGANGIETIEPREGDKLDPHLHLAISQEESAGLAEHSVKRVVMKGYRHNQRILRPANVVSSVRPPAAAEKAE